MQMARDYQNNNIFGHPQWNNNNENRDDKKDERINPCEEITNPPTDIYRAMREDARTSRPSISFEPPSVSAIFGSSSPVDDRPSRPYEKNPYASQEDNKKKKIFDEAMAELKALDGMGPVQEKIEEALALAQTFEAREKFGLKNVNHALHMVFTGNAGTGKTTVARLVGKLFYGAGLLKKGKITKTQTDRERIIGREEAKSNKPFEDVPFVECSNSDISSAFWGEDEKNMKKKLDDSNGGVLFIDEAYSMLSRSGHRSGEKVMAVLVQEMENRRNSVCVICAGYTKDMEEFIQYNQGLASRFATTIHFPNYGTPQLLKIAEGMAKDRDYVISEDYRILLGERLDKERLHPQFGNGRTVRNVIEESIRIHAKRVHDQHGSNPSREQLITLEKSDIRPFSPIYTGKEIVDPYEQFYKQAVKQGIVSGDKSKLPPRVRTESPRQ